MEPELRRGLLSLRAEIKSLKKEVESVQLEIERIKFKSDADFEHAGEINKMFAEGLDYLNYKLKGE